LIWRFQWLKRELEKTYPRARALMDEVDANDYEAVCLFESDMEAFSNQYGREPKGPPNGRHGAGIAAGRKLN
jgi:hypothetical protein